MNDRGHKWKTDDFDGSIDAFGFEAGEYHNGPKCSVCGYGFCQHCEDEPQIDCPGVPLETERSDYDDEKLDKFVVNYAASLRGY